MEVFVLIVLGGIVAAVVVSRHKKKVNEAWWNAAKKLRLNYTGDSAGRIIEGQHGDILLRVETERAEKATWTSYKAEFPEPLPFPVQLQPQNFLSTLGNSVLNRIDLETGDEWFDSKVIIQSSEPGPVRDFLDRRARAAVTRLIAQFDEFEINEHRVGVKHERLVSEAGDVVESVRVLEDSIRDLWASAIPEVVGKPKPPPLPPKGQGQLEDAEPSLEVSGEEVEPAVVHLPESGAIEEARYQRPESTNAGQPLVFPEADEEEHSSAPEEKPLDSLFAHHCREVFADCRSRYEMTKQFGTELEGTTVDDHLTLVDAESYSMDRIFGRGPGIRRKFSLGQLPDGNELLLVADSDEESTLRDLRSREGKADSVIGTISSFDPFAHTLFLKTPPMPEEQARVAEAEVVG